jgi:hypothetical protein
MKKRGRLLPNWIPNIMIISFVVFINVFFSCQIIAISYKLSKMSDTYQNLKSWGQYYHAQILKEISEENIREKAEKMGLALKIPESWKIQEINDNQYVTNQNNGKREESVR